MKKLIMFIVLAVSSIVLAQIPNPGDTNNWSNATNEYHEAIPQTPINGAIISATMTTNVIEWWNFNHHAFEVEWRQKLTDGSWTNIGNGYNAFEHQYPEGFYRVLERPDVAVFPIWNSGTTDMVWTASTDCAWLDIECVNTNIPPEWGEGYVIAYVDTVQTNGSEGYVTVFTVGAGIAQTQQVTVVYNED